MQNPPRESGKQHSALFGALILQIRSIVSQRTAMAAKQPLRAITAAELQRHGSPQSCWTAINGLVYDITSFMPKHPGGFPIRLGGGRNSTCLFESYHPLQKSQKVESVLSTLPVVGFYVETEQDAKQPNAYERATTRPDDKFFRTVRERVDAHMKANGMPRHHSEFIGITELVASIAIYWIASAWAGLTGSYAAAMVLGIMTGRLGFIMHTGNHSAFSRYYIINRVAAYMMDMVGSASLVWSFEHQVAHHTEPNVVGKDNDCSIGDPYVRFHPDVKPNWWQQWQHFTVPLAMTTGFFKWYFSDIQCLWDGKVGSVSFHVTWRDWAWLLFWKTQWPLLHVILPGIYTIGWWRVLVFVLIALPIGSLYLENIFIVNHIQEDLAYAQKDLHWSTRQVLTTSNWSAGNRFWNWFSGGLNHQLEHHLFPSMSIFCYPHIAAIVRKTCLEFGLPYSNYDNYAVAWAAMISYLKRLGESSQKMLQSKAF